MAEQGWDDWLAGLADGIAEPAAKLWGEIQAALPNLRPPTGAGMKDDGYWVLCWDDEEHHLDFEIVEAGFEWFYRNRKTGQFEGGGPVEHLELEEGRLSQFLSLIAR